MNRKYRMPVNSWPASRFYMTVLAIVFAAEAAVMGLLPALLPPGIHRWIEALVDASLLTLILAPILGRIIVRPLRVAAVTEQAKSAAIIDAAASWPSTWPPCAPT